MLKSKFNNIDDDYFIYSCDNYGYYYGTKKIPLLFLSTNSSNIHYLLKKFNPDLSNLRSQMESCFKDGFLFDNVEVFKIYEDFFKDKDNEKFKELSVTILEYTSNEDLKKYIIENHDLPSLINKGYYIDDLFIRNAQFFSEDIKKEYFPKVKIVNFSKNINSEKNINKDKDFINFIDFLEKYNNYYSESEVIDSVFNAMNKFNLEKNFLIDTIKLLKDKKLIDIETLKLFMIHDDFSFIKVNDSNYLTIIKESFLDDFIENYKSFNIKMIVPFINEIIDSKGIASIFERYDSNQSLFEFYMFQKMFLYEEYKDIFNYITSFEINNYIGNNEFNLILTDKEITYSLIKQEILKLNPERLNEIMSCYNDDKNYVDFLIKTISNIEKKSIEKHLIQHESEKEYKKRL